MIVVRYHYGENRLANSAPCSKCAHVLKQSGIQKIIYSDIDGKLVMVNTNEYVTTHQTCGTLYRMKNEIIDRIK